MYMPKIAHSAVATACVAMYHGVPTRATAWISPKKAMLPQRIFQRRNSIRAAGESSSLPVCMPPPEDTNGLTNNQAPERPGLIRKWFGSSIRKHFLRPLDASSFTSVRANDNHHNTVSIGDLSKTPTLAAAEIAKIAVPVRR